jgi:hypothetical protein
MGRDIGLIRQKSRSQITVEALLCVWQPGDCKPVSEAGHEPRRKRPCLPSARDRQTWFFPHQVPTHPAGFRTRPGQRHRRHRNSLCPIRFRVRFHTTPDPTGRLIISLRGKVSAAHPDERNVPERFERH